MPRFTHFVEFQIKDPTILDGMQKFMDDYLNKFPNSQLKHCAVRVSNSHVTLKLMDVPERDSDRVIEVFQAVASRHKDKFRDSKLTLDSVCSKRLRHGDQLISVRVDAGQLKLRVQELVNDLHEQAEKHGWRPNNDRLDLHCSLFNTKMLKRFQELPQEELEYLKQNKAHLFGDQAIASVQLLSMKKSSDYYIVIDEYSF